MFLVLTTFLGTMSAARYYRTTRATHWPKFIVHRVLRTLPMMMLASFLMSTFNYAVDKISPCVFGEPRRRRGRPPRLVQIARARRARVAAAARRGRRR